MLQVKLCLLQIEKKYIYFAFVTESHHLGLFLNIFINLFAIFPNANVKNNGLKVWTCTWHHCIQHMYTLTTGAYLSFHYKFLIAFIFFNSGLWNLSILSNNYYVSQFIGDVIVCCKWHMLWHHSRTRFGILVWKGNKHCRSH